MYNILVYFDFSKEIIGEVLVTIFVDNSDVA